MNFSRFDFLDNGSILVIDENGSAIVHGPDSLFKNWNCPEKSFSVRVKQLYDAYITLRDQAQNTKSETIQKPKQFLIFDYEDENVVEVNVGENEIQNVIRRYAEEDCEGFEEDFRLGVYELKDNYLISQVQKINITKL
jgi:RecB family endonuclease NucS